MPHFKTSGFFNHRQIAIPNLTDPSRELWIGYSQVGDSPFYYFLAALPLRLLKDAPIPTQLYAGRLVSLLFYLLTIWAAIQFAAELTPPGSPLRWLLPLFLALLPGFTEFMTALNNHTAAIGLGSVWIWLAVTAYPARTQVDGYPLLILSDRLVLHYPADRVDHDPVVPIGFSPDFHPP